MTEQTLSLNMVAATDKVTDSYWLNMEVKKDPVLDGMTVAEAASIIDAAYNIKPCESAELQENDIWQPDDSDTLGDIWTDVVDASTVDADKLAAQKRFVDAISPYTTRCDEQNLSELISYDVTIKVFRSHREELYKLQMANGLAEPATKHGGRVVHTIDIDGRNSHTFNNPIIENPVISWQGFDGPEIHIIGNTAYWDGPVEATIRAEFDTEWDEVKIRVTGEYDDSSMIEGTDDTTFGTGWYSGSESGEEIDDYQDIQCSVLAFYHYQYEELILNRPEDDESVSETDKVNICSFITAIGDDDGGEGEDPDPDAKCQQNVNETTICQCSGEERLNSYYEPVPCPGGVNDGATIPGSVARRIYADCGYRDSASDPDFYEDTCCQTPKEAEVGLPLCKKLVTRFMGTNKKNYKESDYPLGTKFVVVSPVDAQCGEHVTEQVINAKNCCDGVSDLAWDAERSVSVLYPDDIGSVSVTGGKTPVTWQVRGSGFWTNAAHTERDVVSESAIAIYTDADACGRCAIYATDGCTSATGYVLATQGVWEAITPCAGATTLVYWFPSGNNVYVINENDGLRDANTYRVHVVNSPAECDALMAEATVIDCCGYGGLSESGTSCLVPIVANSWKWVCP